MIKIDNSCRDQDERMMKYEVTVNTSLRQDGNGNWVTNIYTFDTFEEAEQFAKQKSNGWVHCYIRAKESK